MRASLTLAPLHYELEHSRLLAGCLLPQQPQAPRPPHPRGLGVFQETVRLLRAAGGALPQCSHLWFYPGLGASYLPILAVQGERSRTAWLGLGTWRRSLRAVARKPVRGAWWFHSPRVPGQAPAWRWGGGGWAVPTPPVSPAGAAATAIYDLGFFFPAAAPLGLWRAAQPRPSVQPGAPAGRAAHFGAQAARRGRRQGYRLARRLLNCWAPQQQPSFGGLEPTRRPAHWRRRRPLRYTRRLPRRQSFVRRRRAQRRVRLLGVRRPRLYRARFRAARRRIRRRPTRLAQRNPRRPRGLRLAPPLGGWGLGGQVAGLPLGRGVLAPSGGGAGQRLSGTRVGAALSARLAVPRPAASPLMRQVRYRPGLSRHWRVHRRAYVQSYALPFYRQRRLTNYVAQLRRITGFAYLRALELSLAYVATSLHLGVTLSFLASWAQVRAFGWLVNGQPATNPFLQLYRGDWLSQRAGTLADLAARQLLARDLLSPALVRQQVVWQSLLGAVAGAVPRRVLDAPAYLEVDELTCSATVLYEPMRLGALAMLRVQPGPFLTVRMYNWKYAS